MFFVEQIITAFVLRPENHEHQRGHSKDEPEDEKERIWFPRLHLAEAYKKQGRLSNQLERDLLLRRPFERFVGGFPLYTDTRYNQIMEDVAKRYNVDIVNAGQVLDKNPSYYVDYCHIDQDGHRRVAELLYEHLNNLR